MPDGGVERPFRGSVLDRRIREIDEFPRVVHVGHQELAELVDQPARVHGEEASAPQAGPKLQFDTRDAHLSRLIIQSATIVQAAAKNAINPSHTAAANCC